MRTLVALLFLVLAACATATSGGNPSAAPSSAASSSNPYYVCHGKTSPKWKRVAVDAVDAHRRHGDRVVSSPQRAGTACSQ